MVDTLENLRLIIQQKDRNRNESDLAKEYRETLNPSILALMFEKNYGMINILGRQYEMIPKEDLASLSLEVLDKCLIEFDAEKATFVTFFTNNLKFRLREESSLLNTHKRKATYYSSSFEIMQENGFDINTSDSNNFEILDLINRELSGNLKRYCQLVIQGFTNPEIANMLGVSHVSIHNYRKKLQKLLQPSLNF